MPPHGETGNEVQGVLIHITPVIFLLIPSAYALAKTDSVCSAITPTVNMVMGCVWRKCVNSVKHVVGHVRTAAQHTAEVLYIRFGRQFADQHEIKQPFRQGLCASGSFREMLAQLGDGIPAETDTFICIQQGGFGHQPCNATHALVSLSYRNVAYFLCSMILEQVLNLCAQFICLCLEFLFYITHFPTMI